MGSRIPDIKGQWAHTKPAQSIEIPRRLGSSLWGEYCRGLRLVNMRLGVFCILDSECLMPSSTDQTCLSCSAGTGLSEASFLPTWTWTYWGAGVVRLCGIEVKSITPSRTPRWFSPQQHTACAAGPASRHGLAYGRACGDGGDYKVYKPSRFASTNFAVQHYAGEVVYDVASLTCEELKCTAFKPILMHLSACVLRCCPSWRDWAILGWFLFAMKFCSPQAPSLT